MMRNIAIGLAAATIAIGCSALSASALNGQQSGISKGSMSGSANSDRFGPRTYGFSDQGPGKRLSELTPGERERLRGTVRERLSELTPLQRERLRSMVRERYAELTPLQRERLRGIIRKRYAELTPLQRERLRGVMLEHYQQMTPLERERLFRRGPYGSR